jgi:hypothetical protein
MIKISKIIFYNKFLISTMIPKLEYMPALGGGSIINYLNNLILYINKIDLKFNKEL